MQGVFSLITSPTCQVKRSCNLWKDPVRQLGSKERELGAQVLRTDGNVGLALFVLDPKGPEDVADGVYVACGLGRRGPWMESTWTWTSSQLLQGPAVWTAPPLLALLSLLPPDTALAHLVLLAAAASPSPSPSSASSSFSIFFFF